MDNKLKISLLFSMETVKGLVDAGVEVVPQDYIRSREADSVIEDCDEIPVVDLSQFDEFKPQIMDSVHKACQEWGFFQLKGHGVPADLMKNMRKLVFDFFDLPAEERMSYFGSNMDRERKFQFTSGFNPHLEKTKQWHDSLFQFCNPPPTEEELPTKSLPSFRQVSVEYAEAMGALARRLLGIFSECFGFASETFDNAIFKSTRHTMRMNYYPPCPNPELVIGLETHSDPGGFTVLQQDYGLEGLQVLKNGKWIKVKSLEGALVINVADQLEILTNGVYRSVEHRAVVNPTKERVSIATFYCPHRETYVAPVEELILGSKSANFKGCKFGDYLDAFLASALGSKDYRSNSY